MIGIWDGDVVILHRLKRFGRKFLELREKRYLR
jgi:hypothetical protein